MCRPCSSPISSLILGALAALLVGGCGKGLYTRVAQLQDQDGSSGGVTDPGTGSGTGGSTSSDASIPADGGSIRNPDVSSNVDAEPGPCTTHWVSNGAEAAIPCEDATFIIPKGSAPPGANHAVTLKLLSKDGTLTLVNGDGTKQDYSGTGGPIYSITADCSQSWNPTTLRIHIVPDSSIPSRPLGLASVNEASKIWVKAPDSKYDPNANVVSGTVNLSDPCTSDMRYFAPVETCIKDDPAGETCHFGLKCKGEACQK
jgi:hypothetical protein